MRHLSEEDRRRSGREGKDRQYATTAGLRGFAAGDQLMFLENSLSRGGLGVRNGDRGTLVQAKKNEIVVALDGDAKHVAFSPKAYRSFDYASACTVHKSQGASVEAAVSLLDRSASAELLFVATSRSKRELDITVPRSTFKNLEDLAAHISERISLKTTTQTFGKVLERTGGKETIHVRNIEAQREALPLRRVYEADIVEPLRALQEERVREARETYQQRKGDIETSSLQLEQRLEARRDSLRETRKSITNAYRELRPQAFGEWLQDRETWREKASSRSQHQEQSVERAQAREQSFVLASQLAQSAGVRLGR